MTGGRALFLSMVLLAGLAVPRPSLASDASPSGAWVVETAKPTDDLTAPGIVWILASDGISFIREGKLMRQAPCTTQEIDPGTVRFMCGTTALLFSKPVNGRVTVRFNWIEATLRQASPAESERYVQLIAADKAAARGICERARRCCAEAMPLVGGSCDKDSLPREENVTECENALNGYRTLLDAMGKKVPARCAKR